MAPGSYLALSVGTSEGADPEMLAEADPDLRAARGCRSRSGRGLRSWNCSTASSWSSPGLVSLPEWRPEFNTDRTPLRGPTVGAVARLAR